MGRKKPVREKESFESSKQGGGGGGKSKRKNWVIDDGDCSVGTELSEETVVLEDKAELVPEISEKRGKKSRAVFHAIDDEDNESGQVSEKSTVAFTGKKKSSKKKNRSASMDTAYGNDSTNVADQDHCSLGVNREDADDNIGKKQTADVLETSKNKTKKKKGGHASNVLAELGEGSTITAPAQPAHSSLPREEKSQQQSQLGDDTGEREVVEEEVVESAAAKKKKKKKEKEKKKKAATAAAAVSEMEEKQEATKNDTKGKLAEKKQSKQVREIQERLKKMKEAEESKKKEEEERLRKEEEEHLRLEELKRLVEEKKHLKKEREKEKLLKKKLEGKLLTGKQKEEARRLEAMRNQFLASGGALPHSTEESRKDATKRPIYQSKKSKAQAWVNGKAKEESVGSTEVQENQQEIVSEVESLETEKDKDINLVSVEEKSEVADAEENRVEEEEDEEEWDARSWDDADLKLPGKSVFEDEELDSDPQPIIKKAARSVVSDTGPLAAKSVIPTQKAVASVPAVTKNDGSNKREPEVMVSGQGTEKSGASSSKSEDSLRSPICCIMGHVDTGKTKLLDCIRGTNVQEGEAGGITQQIGATYFPAENIRERTKELKADAKLKVPGLLVIDTPGHESFTNLRSRGSGLCDIAILVVDITHGLEPQTIESLNLLKMRNTEFVVALNKIDRLYGWKVCRNAPIVKAMKQQSKDVQFEFNTRLTQIVTQFKEQGINTELYYKNKEMGKDTFSIIPTSAISGEGIPDLLLLLVQWTQKTMVDRLTYSSECTVLEVKAIEGHGTTIDVVLINGILHEGDQIIVCGMQDPIVTSIRALLTPHPMKELRIKGSYLHHKEIKAAQSIKINAQGLEHAIAGTSLYVVGPDDDVENVKEAAMEDMRSVMSRIDKSGEGVHVQASTLGSLEALLEFLKTDEVRIPVSGIGIGPVHKKDVMKAIVMLEKKKEYAIILAFDVKVTQEARELADEAGVKIFIADIIYHLFDQFKAYIDNLKEEKKKEVAEEAVFPCSLKIVPNHVYNKKDPIVVGVDVLEGIAKVGTPICIPQREFIDIGRIASIQNNHRPVDSAKKGQRVAIKIVGSNSEEQQKMFGRHFEIEDELVSKVSRRSIDILKANFRNDLSIEDWRLVKTLKNLFKIQ
uniref:Eukaryotic translation initiation factor 5B n=1 Tax=Solanum lycopersicum TaxID=4081 RepID=A0A3Q7GT69_SOLLC